MVGLLAEDRHRAQTTLRRVPTLHIARIMPRPLNAVPLLLTSETPEPSAPGALLHGVARLPDHMTTKQVAMMPGLVDDGLHQPWLELSSSGMLVLSRTAYDITLQRSVAVELLLRPESLSVPAVGDVLRHVAEAVLGTVLPETLLRVALHWAFACEVHRRPWAENREALARHDLSGPETDRPSVSHAPHLLILPQAVRLLAVEAVCSCRYSDAADAFDLAALGVLERDLVAEFFPSAVTSQQPGHSEIRTALWILSHGTLSEGFGDDGPPLMMAHTFGTRSVGEPQESLRHWCELLSLPDDHPYGSWDPSDAPSVLREDLRSTCGVEMSDVAAAIYWVLTTMMEAQEGGNQLFTLAMLLALASNELGDSARAALAFASGHLVTTVDQLRASLDLDDTTGTDDSGHVAERQGLIYRQLVDRPFVQFDDGTIIPVGLPDAVHGTIEFCQAAHNGQREAPEERRQRIGRCLGRLFEARIREMCHSLHLQDGHRVIDRDVIDTVTDREAGVGSKRADVVIGHIGGDYLVIEATKSNLRPGIRYGDQTALDSWADVHLGKLEQATATAEHLPAITTACGAPPPRRITCLVVEDLPLRQDIALSAVLDERSDTRRPPFLGGITEFEMLIEVGQQGISVPLIAWAWQHSGTDESLGLFLCNYPFR